MNYLFLFITIISVCTQDVLAKQYSEKCISKSNGIAYNLIKILSGLAFFILLTKGSLVMHLPTLKYSLAFAVAFAIASTFCLLAISNGSLSLTSLVISYSLIIPTFYGIIFLKEPITYLKIFGIICLVISLFLISQVNTKNRITLKWVWFTALAFAGNGMCSSIQKIHQMHYPGQFRLEFMIIALLIVSIFYLIWLFKLDKKVIFSEFKEVYPYSTISGLSNAIANFLVMVLSSKMQASVMFPLISAGWISINFFVSTFVFKEQLSTRQIIGGVIGVLSIVILNI